jgi:hypothetical protein
MADDSQLAIAVGLGETPELENRETNEQRRQNPRSRRRQNRSGHATRHRQNYPTGNPKLRTELSVSSQSDSGNARIQVTLGGRGFNS